MRVEPSCTYNGHRRNLRHARTIVQRLVVTATAALALLGLMAPTASAEASKTVSASVTHRGGAHFYDYGDKLHVGDYLKDGNGVRAYLIWDSHKSTVYTNRGVNGEDNLNLNLREGTPVYLTLCYTQKGKM